MPKIKINDADIYYEEHGQGPEAILFIHGFLMNCHTYDQQVMALKDRFRCICYDQRGHGLSEVTEEGYDIYALVEDAAALIEQLECAPCHVVGISMGGYTAMRLAKRYPQLVRSLILICTSAAAEAKADARKFKFLGFVHNRISQSFAVSQVEPILFGQKWLTDTANEELHNYWHPQFLANDKHSFAQTLNGILTRDDFVHELAGMDLPTLIISGEADAASDPAQSGRMHAELPHSQLLKIPEVGHTPPVEAPETVNSAMLDFLLSLPTPAAKATV